MDVRGDIEIRYRPAIDVEEAEQLFDVQELLLVLTREDGPAVLAEVGRKRLPDDGSSSPNWCHVRQVADDPADLDDVLGEWTYRTRTQGERHQSATRVAASGTWTLDRDGRDTIWSVEVARRIDDRQLADQLGITEQAAYVLTVKNPDATREDGPGLEPDETADYPDELRAAFDGNRWAPWDPVELLDHQGAEFLLVPVAT